MHNRLRIVALLAFTAVLWGADERLRVLILTGQSDLPYHDWRQTTPRVMEMLERTGRFEVRVAEPVEWLSAEDMEPYDALLVNYNGPRWPAKIERAIEEFVASGKGLFAFHGACYGAFYGMVFDKRWQASPTGDQGWPAYPRLIGATWDPAKLGHAVRHEFKVDWVDRGHPIARGLDPSFMTDDELYHRLTLLPQSHVLAKAMSAPEKGGTGQLEPMLWTAPFGKGRIAFTPLGHDVKALSAPGVVALFTRSVEWVASGEVTLAAPTR